MGPVARRHVYLQSMSELGNGTRNTVISSWSMMSSLSMLAACSTTAGSSCSTAAGCGGWAVATASSAIWAQGCRLGFCRLAAHLPCSGRDRQARPPVSRCFLAGCTTINLDAYQPRLFSALPPPYPLRTALLRATVFWTLLSLASITARLIICLPAFAPQQHLSISLHITNLHNAHGLDPRRAVLRGHHLRPSC